MARKKPAIPSEPPASARAQRPLLAPDANRSSHSVDLLDASANGRPISMPAA